MFKAIQKNSAAHVFGGKSVVANVITKATKDKDAKSRDKDSKGA